jgi:hypothetical protein
MGTIWRVARVRLCWNGGMGNGARFWACNTRTGSRRIKVRRHCAIMLTVLVIIAIVVWWAVFGPLAFVRGSGKSLPVRHCPHCGYSGRVSGLGRFKCGSCGQHFVLGFRGRHAGSLLSALLPSLVITAIMMVALIALWAHQHDDFIYLPAVLAVIVGIWIFTAFQTKRFPNVDVA